MDNLYELIGASTGIAGAMLLAIKCRLSAWAWPLWIVSGIAWIVYAQATGTYGLLAQQVVFTAINVMGTWRWLVQPFAHKTGERLARTPAANTPTQSTNARNMRSCTDKN